MIPGGYWIGERAALNANDGGSTSVVSSNDEKLPSRVKIPVTNPLASKEFGRVGNYQGFPLEFVFRHKLELGRKVLQLQLDTGS